MIDELVIENFKSISRLRLPLGRLNIFIGENGCGKSNLLEAIAFLGADCAGSLTHEHLGVRGVRMPAAELMRPAFEGENDRPIRFSVRRSGASPELQDYEYQWRTKGLSPEWGEASRNLGVGFAPSDNAALFAEDSLSQEERLQRLLEIGSKKWLERRQAREAWEQPLAKFLIYAPENTALRTFQGETQVLPLGVKGEGLFAHLRQLERREPSALAAVNEQLSLIDWFGGFHVPQDPAPYERSLHMQDRYLTSGQLFDQRSANEGFLYLLFYFTLLISPDTPRFFAVDNIDASLNPKLCRELIRRMAALSVEHDRQLLLTTHNPAALDGLDLSDDRQRLFVVSRGIEGDTRVRRVKAPHPEAGGVPMRLSEAFMGGILGGLPENF